MLFNVAVDEFLYDNRLHVILSDEISERERRYNITHSNSVKMPVAFIPDETFYFSKDEEKGGYKSIGILRYHEKINSHTGYFVYDYLRMANSFFFTAFMHGINRDFYHFDSFVADLSVIGTEEQLKNHKHTIIISTVTWRDPVEFYTDRTPQNYYMNRDYRQKLNLYELDFYKNIDVSWFKPKRKM